MTIATLHLLIGALYAMLVIFVFTVLVVEVKFVEFFFADSEDLQSSSASGGRLRGG